MSGKAFIIQIGPQDDFVNEYLQAHHDVLQLWQEPDALGCLDQRGSAARAVVTSVRHGCTAAMIERMPHLEVICSWGVGYETIAVGAARTRGIQVSYTPEVLNDCVADLAWGLLMASARRTSVGDRYVKTGQWRTIGAFPLSTKVSGKRLGILGLGRIGAAIARRGQGFDMQVRYHNLGRRPNVPYRYEPSLLGVGEEHITKALTKPAQWKIPSDHGTASRSQNTATPLALSDQPISRVICQMARAACGAVETSGKKKRLLSIFG